VLVGAAIAAGAAGGTWYSQHQSAAIARALTDGEPSRAPEIIRRYGCSGCHTISGIAGADGLVGTPLSNIKRRVYVGGVAFNSPQNLVRWIVSPQTFSEHSAMPATGISEAEARDVAAYLYAQ
jgi:mono/diheme cytochrome c family protein